MRESFIGLNVLLSGTTLLSGNHFMNGLLWMPCIGRLVLYLAVGNSLSPITEHDVLEVHPRCRLQALLEVIHAIGAQPWLLTPSHLGGAESRECWHCALCLLFIQSQAPVHGLVLPVFWVGSPSSVKCLWRHLTFLGIYPFLLGFPACQHSTSQHYLLVFLILWHQM